MGQFLRSLWACVFHDLRYEYRDAAPDPDIPNKTHRIFFRNGVVWKIVEYVFPYPGEARIPVTHYVDCYGFPEEIVWSHYRSFFRSALYCRQGIIVHAGHSKVGLVTYIPPMPTNTCVDVLHDEVIRDNLRPADPQKFDDPWDLSAYEP